MTILLVFYDVIKVLRLARGGHVLESRQIVMWGSGKNLFLDDPATQKSIWEFEGREETEYAF